MLNVNINIGVNSSYESFLQYVVVQSVCIRPCWYKVSGDLHILLHQVFLCVFLNLHLITSVSRSLCVVAILKIVFCASAFTCTYISMFTNVMHLCEKYCLNLEREIFEYLRKSQPETWEVLKWGSFMS